MSTCENGNKKKSKFGGWTNPFDKYARQSGSFPQAEGVNINDIWDQHLDSLVKWEVSQ